MKSIVILFLFLSFGLSSPAQTCPIPISLKGKMINAVNLGKQCGDLKLASVIEFEIIEFSDNSYQQKTIGIILRCPEMYSEAYGKNYFEPNHVYEIMVEKEIEGSKSDFTYDIQNTEALKKYTAAAKYWALPGNIMKIE